MDNLTASLPALFRRYQFDFHRMAHMSEVECERVVETFRKEINALLAKYGREAVVRAALLLPAGLPTLN